MIKSKFICLCLVCCISAMAVPMERTVKINQLPLKEESWQFLNGNTANLKVKDSNLIVSTQKAPVELIYRFYPKRFSESRDAFGDFYAKLAIGRTKSSGLVGLGILDRSGFLLKLEYNPVSNQARLIRIWNGQETAGEWVAIDGKGDQADLYLYRRGNTVLGQIAVGKKTTAIASWAGRLAPIVDFYLSAECAKQGNQANVVITQFKLSPLHLYSAYSGAEPRQGRDLKGCADLPAKEKDAGGDYLGGYVWGKEQAAAIDIRVANVKAEKNNVVLVTRVTDWQDREVRRKQNYPLDISPLTEKVVVVKLPTDQFGHFHLTFGLQDADGVPLEAPKTVDYAITAARPAKDLSEKCPVGMHANPFAQLGAKWVRFWDNGGTFLWSHLEREKGKWDWANADAYLQKALATGTSPLVVLAGTPAWASTDTSYGNYLGKGSFSPPRNIEDWKNYCRQVVRRYKGKVRYYEIWNEPNGGELGPKGYFFYGPVEEYFKLVKAASEVIRKEDPDARILAPSGTGNFFPFLDRFCELGGLNYFDILSIHTYCTPFPPEIGYQFNNEKSYHSRVTRAREIMAKYGETKPVWNTEIGYHSGLHQSIAGVPIRPNQIAEEGLEEYWPNWSRNWSFRPQDPRRTTAFITRFMLLSMAYSVEKCFYHHKLIDNRRSPYMPVAAVGWVSTLLTDSLYRKAYHWSDDMQVHNFRLADGRHCIAYWRVEDETLLMDKDREKKLGKVDSAPIAGIADQRGLKFQAGVVKSLGRSYFSPTRKVSVALGTKQLKAKGAEATVHDIWGNEIPFADQLPIDEAPHYLVFKADPGWFWPAISKGTPKDMSAPYPGSDKGKIGVPDADALKNQSLPASPFDLLPGSIKLSLKGVVLPNGKVNNGGTIVIHDQDTCTWTLPADTPTKARILLSVRSSDRQSQTHNYRYSIIHNNQEIPLTSWPTWPCQIYGVGDGWAETQGMVISPPLLLHSGDKLKVKCYKPHGRIYDIGLFPMAAK